MMTDPLNGSSIPSVPSFALDRAREHQCKIKEVLSAKGFDDLPVIRIKPDDPNAVPLAFITGVNVERFDSDIHKMTPTKMTVQDGNDHYMLNQSAALLPVLLEHSNHEIVIQVRPDRAELVEKLIKTMKGGERVHIIAIPTHDEALTADFYHVAAGIAAARPVSRIDLTLYESFAAGMLQPFKPIYAEDPALVGQATTKRALFYHNMCMIAYHLLAQGKHDALRVVSLTALAARRMGGNLLADAAHKQISTNYLETLANETRFHFPQSQIYCVEVAPGVVDNGIYDHDDARLATVERAAINGFPFGDESACAQDISDMPKLSPQDIAYVAMQYMVRAPEEPFHDELPRHIQHLSYAGQSDPGVVPMKLPSWAGTQGVSIGEFPALTEGYQFIPVCPAGQYF